VTALTSEQAKCFAAAVAAATRPDVNSAVENVYRALQDAIDLRRPICTSSGRCCRFEEFGHRLFVTTLEMAAFVSQANRPLNPGAWDKTGCPFQLNRLCDVHEIRPFGCRIFFCDETSTQWQAEQYERFHREIKRLHEELGVPYFYVEWRQALAALDHRANHHANECCPPVE
jgi:Fe-S-cluster containining protein